jgi:hypothetical protein
MMISDLRIQRVSWDEVKDAIQNINSEFFNIVQNIKLNRECSLYLVEFPYGNLIGDHISQFLPVKSGEYIRLTDEGIPQFIKKDLGYGINNSPIGMVVKKKIELFIDLPEKKMVLPHMVLSPGEFFSYNHILDIEKSINYAPNGILYAMSGARSCFLLPSINCENKFSRLCRGLGLKIKRPINIYEQNNLFKQVLESNQINNAWASSIIYFSEEWVKNINENPEWYSLKQYFHSMNTRRTLFPLNVTHYNTAFSLLLEKMNFNPNPYVFDTFKHIVQIMCGQIPGLSPLVDEEFLPLNDLHHIFQEYYGFNEIFPTIMGPSLFDPFAKSPHPIYYSLQIPTTSSFSPKSKKTSVMVELKELFDLCETLLTELKCDKGFCANTIIQYIAKYLSISFHHNSQDIDNIILPVDSIIESDARFANKNKQLASENGKFFRGCVKIYKSTIAQEEGCKQW